MTAAEPRELDVRADGGNLRVLLWGTGDRLVVALHGITASAMSWCAVGARLPGGWTLAAPDLRGRGASSGLPGPYGFDSHVADVAAVVGQLGGRADVLAGHSLGAYIALLAHDAHPGLASRLVLLDGGLPMPVPEGADPDALLDLTLGPSLARLRQTFPDADAYVRFWREHPAFGDWNADAEAYVRYDLTPCEGGLRSRADEAAVRADGRDLLTAGPRFADALTRLKQPTVLLTAPAGMFGAPPGMLPAEAVAAWSERAPQLRPREVPDVNHYTLLFAPDSAADVARTLAS